MYFDLTTNHGTTIQVPDEFIVTLTKDPDCSSAYSSAIPADFVSKTYDSIYPVVSPHIIFANGAAYGAATNDPTNCPIDAYFESDALGNTLANTDGNLEVDQATGEVSEDSPDREFTK